MSNPRVSTTIISFNQNQYLEESIVSALDQTYDNHEIVIRDDASTDGSQEIIRRYEAKYPHVIRALYAHTNGGLAANRDACQRATTGDYVAWLDADDIARPNRVEAQVDFLEQHRECSLVYCNLNLASMAGESQKVVYGAHRPPHTGDHRALLLHDSFVISSGLMYRANSLAVRGYHQPEGPTYSDLHFVVRLASRGKIGYVDEVLGTYRRHALSATANIKFVSNGVQRRKEQALRAMEKELAEDVQLVRYCLARFYASQLSNAVKQRNVAVMLRAALNLALRPSQAARAIADRRSGRYLLPSFEHQRGSA